jgi:hypothetical protein
VQDLYGEFKALILGFNAEGIPYAVCGGLAFAIHVQPRATVDIDLLIQEADVPRCQQILMDMGYTPHPKPMAFTGGAVRIQRFWKPQEQGGDVLMVDLLLANDEAMPGVWEGRQEMRWEDLPVWVVSRHGLVILKRLRGSKQDIADMERLGGPGVDQ